MPLLAGGGSWGPMSGGRGHVPWVGGPCTVKSHVCLEGGAGAGGLYSQVEYIMGNGGDYCSDQAI